MEAFSSRLTFGQMESSPGAHGSKEAVPGLLRKGRQPPGPSFPVSLTPDQTGQSAPAFQRLQLQNQCAGCEISYELESDGQRFAVALSIMVVSIK